LDVVTCRFGPAGFWDPAPHLNNEWILLAFYHAWQCRWLHTRNVNAFNISKPL
jgi:hypothetical protein